MTYHVLLVDPEQERFPQLDKTVRNVADLTLVKDFLSARRALLESPPDLLVTNLKLGPYNGIHLALLANVSLTRCIVYAQQLDVVLARQVQAAGAFYARVEQLPFVLPAFLTFQMPLRDRRNPAVVDRRKAFRNGRRTTDVEILNAAARPGAVVKFDPRVE